MRHKGSLVQSRGMIQDLWTPGHFSKDLVFLVKDLPSLSDRLWLSPLFHEGAQNLKLIYLSILAPSGLDFDKAYGWRSALEAPMNFLDSCEHANK
jgi:hypothetical protein